MAANAASEGPPKDGGFYRCGMRRSSDSGMRWGSPMAGYPQSSTWHDPPSRKSSNSNGKGENNSMVDFVTPVFAGVLLGIGASYLAVKLSPKGKNGFGYLLLGVVIGQIVWVVLH